MLHFTTRTEWERGRALGRYQPDAMAADGFVHLSFGHQLGRVATERVAGASDLVVLVVDPRGLEDDLHVEGGFPHLYRPIPVSSVALEADFPPEADGTFVVPEHVRLADLAVMALPSFDAVLDRCRSVMAGFAGPWWIGGGWAVDAGAGSLSRPHLDVDVVALRPDAPALSHHLADCDVRLPGGQGLAEWRGHELAPADHQLWVRPDDGERPERWQDFAADPGFFEILFEQVDVESGTWSFRRNPAVSGPLERFGRPGGFLSPEVALLYKAAAAGGTEPAAASKAQRDFDHAVGHLGSEQRAWLASALQLAHPGHHWTSVLSGESVPTEGDRRPAG